MRRLVLALGFVAAPLAAQEPHRDPPQPIARILDTLPLPCASPSPDRSPLLLLERNALPPIEDVAAPELWLAGLPIDPCTFGPARPQPLRGLVMVPVDGGPERGTAPSAIGPGPGDGDAHTPDHLDDGGMPRRLD